LAPEALAVINVTIEEILNELNVNNLDRLATFVRLAPDTDLTAAQKISFAISGWLIGSGAALDNLAVAMALVDARRLCVEYLTTADADRRLAILGELETIEAGDPNYLARIIQHLLPPNAPSSEVNLKEPLQFEVEIPGVEADSGTRFVPYAVQLPPQYDPYRRYPCIVALHAEGQSLNAQLAWWAGVYSPQLEMPIGQASRHGYIVIAPEWRQGQSRDFEFSAIEHLAVLKSVRDALRRFSIDTDRIYLAGHFGGGDAAWDIGLSFPDLWAGVIPISAAAGPGGKYAFRCHETVAGQTLAFHFVCGQHDLGRIVDNKLVWNKWMQSPNYDVTLVEYQGRLAESFAEAQPELFRWMARHKRVFPVEEFTARSLRPWTRQYWWVEVDRLEPDEVVLPIQWPPAEKILPVHFDCKFLRPQNKFIINAAKGTTATLWLLPEMVDFSQNLEISGRGSDYRGPVTPSRAVLLEDVRTRGDRQHPYWAKLVCERATWRPQ
jgi:pimeloyl-ACP methyl ester carboxylesterase